MANPLLLIGPGGDYTTRYDARGLSLVRASGTAASSAGADSDTDTAGSFASWGQTGRRGSRPRSRGARSEASGEGAIDSFEHASPAAPAGYGEQTSAARLDATAAAAEALLTWLESQRLMLGDFSRQFMQARRDLAALLKPADPTPREGAERPSGVGVPPASGERVGFVVPQTPRRPLRAIPLSRAGRTSAIYLPPLAPATAAGSVAVPGDPTPAGANPPGGDAGPRSAAPATETLTHEPDAQTTDHPHPHSRPAPGAWLLAHHAGARRRIGRLQGHRLRARRGAHQEGGAAPSAEQGSLFGNHPRGAVA